MVTALCRSTTILGYSPLFKIVFVTVVYLDLFLTLLALQSGFIEMNPFMLRLLGKPGELLMVKVVAPAFIAWLVPAKLLLPSIGFMVAVTGWNVTELVTSL